MSELSDEIIGYEAQNKRMNDMQSRLLKEQERLSESQSKQDQQISLRANQIAEAYLQKEEKRIRADAVEKSRSVVQGKVTENLIPYFDVCKYNPRDMRFFGSPLDFIIFDGLDEGTMRKIVFVEVKTGKSKLSGREKLVKNCIDQKLIEYEIWTI
jgi:predicted Holliday junction resolvase-like endonuclease